MNENKNNLKISKKKMEELKILKVLNVVIGEDETKYRVITIDGEVEFIEAKKLEE